MCKAILRDKGAALRREKLVSGNDKQEMIKFMVDGSVKRRSSSRAVPDLVGKGKQRLRRYTPGMQNFQA